MLGAQTVLIACGCHRCGLLHAKRPPSARPTLGLRPDQMHGAPWVPSAAYACHMAQVQQQSRVCQGRSGGGHHRQGIRCAAQWPLQMPGVAQRRGPGCSPVLALTAPGGEPASLLAQYVNGAPVWSPPAGARQFYSQQLPCSLPPQSHEGCFLCWASYTCKAPFHVLSKARCITGMSVTTTAA